MTTHFYKDNAALSAALQDASDQLTCLLELAGRHGAVPSGFMTDLIEELSYVCQKHDIAEGLNVL